MFFLQLDWTKNGLFLVFSVQLKVNYKQTNSCKFSCCFPMSANYKCARMVHQCPQESLQMNADFNKITTVLPRLVPITINCNLVTNIQTATTSGWAGLKSLLFENNCTTRFRFSCTMWINSWSLSESRAKVEGRLVLSKLNFIVRSSSFFFKQLYQASRYITLTQIWAGTFQKTQIWKPSTRRHRAQAFSSMSEPCFPSIILSLCRWLKTSLSLSNLEYIVKDGRSTASKLNVPLWPGHWLPGKMLIT